MTRLNAIAFSNDSYKLAVDALRKYLEFKENEYVVVCLCPKRFPKNTLKKLHARAIGPFRILKRLGSNTYLLDLPSNLTINPVFNMVDLFPY